MSFKDCIRNAHEAGEITLEERQALERRFDALYRQLKSRGAAKDALAAELAAEAAEKKRRALLTEDVRKRLLSELHGHRDHRGRADLAQAIVWKIEHHGQAKFMDVEHKAKAILGEVHGELETLLYEFRKGAFRGDLRRRGGEVAARLENVVREAAGEATGDAAAKALAGSWMQIAEKLRQRFNAAGGAIGKLGGWFLPQLHNPEALHRVTLDEWRAFIRPRLDRERMLHPITGLKMTDEELDEALEVVFERVRTDGWIDREASGAAFGKGALFRQHSDHRFLHFRDADAWLEYQRAFGQGDPFAAMMGHVNTMARDIALMEELGPNPRAMLEYLKQLATKAAMTRDTVAAKRARQQARIDELAARIGRPSGRVANARAAVDALLAEIAEIRGDDGLVVRRRPESRTEAEELRYEQLQAALVTAQRDLIAALKAEKVDPGLQRDFQDALEDLVEPVAGVPLGRRPVERVARKLRLADDLYKLYTGASNTPVSSTAANFVSSVRDVITASSLGSAMLTAITDAGFQMMARHFNGLPVARQVLDVGRAIGAGGRREAVRAGLILDASIHVLQQQAQYVGRINTSTVTGRLADRVLAASGLSMWTQGGKHAYGLSIQATLADHADRKLGDLPDALSAMLERHGLDARQWDAIRAAPVHDAEGVGLGILRPQEVEQVAGRHVSERYLAMILRETAFAVPETTLRSRVLLLGDTQPGTARGEILRAMSQFKSFGVAVVMLQGGRVFREITGGNIWRGARYAGGLLVATTLLGGLSLQLKELAGGRDPREADPRGKKGQKFWAQAMLQGGGMGIWGDFLFADVNRFGGGMSQTLAGPMVDRFDQIRRLTIGNSQQLAAGERTNVGRESVQFLKQNTPGASLWWLRLAWERVAMDQLQQLADPEAHAAFRRRVQARKRDFGNEYWWAPGETRPARGPRIGGMLAR